MGSIAVARGRIRSVEIPADPEPHGLPGTASSSDVQYWSPTLITPGRPPYAPIPLIMISV